MTLILDELLRGLLDLFFPECCAWCGGQVWEVPWWQAGPPVAGLRPWDRPHACRSCVMGAVAGGADCGRGVGIRRILEPGLKVWAGCWTCPGIVQAIGMWKYHGVRGLAWPLSAFLVAARRQAEAEGLSAATLVPVPLHPGRRRERGFNQAELLARLAAQEKGTLVAAEILRRPGATAQQARLADPRQRRDNVSRAFKAQPPPTGAPNEARLLLVDDVVTSGATIAAAAAALTLVGWRVDGALCLALARQPDDPTGAG